MSDDPEIPERPPDDRGGEAAIDDQPLGVPENEPPSAG